MIFWFYNTLILTEIHKKILQYFNLTLYDRKKNTIYTHRHKCMLSILYFHRLVQSKKFNSGAVTYILSVSRLPARRMQTKAIYLVKCFKVIFEQYTALFSFFLKSKHSYIIYKTYIYIHKYIIVIFNYFLQSCPIILKTFWFISQKLLRGLRNYI